MQTNGFKAALREGKRQVGLWQSLANPYSAEICATAGFDWLLFDGEHSPNDLRAVLAQLQAIAPYRSQPIVRPVEGNTALIKQYLDVGVQTLLVPMIDTAEQARDMVCAVRYPPQGRRGVGAAVARASRWGLDGDYIARANDEICLIVQIESATAVANIEAICAVDGVDAAFVGPADLTASMGHGANQAHPEVQAAIEDAIKRIVASGKAAGTLCADLDTAARYFLWGCSFVGLGNDVKLLAAAARGLAASAVGKF
ncbi:HpcH/HpaI aldolase family protein [Achromobacter xylosoxidans]|uniref:HpcH/HpaI aldolase family protein n=1 Tax=Alcaligenes xylosoxydans xylosoxydans TaxID=85698 RepID=UPI001F140AF3|nr:HpcH/HpaI aldolase/citrate lyase family protein [Achromobacter xylosoxidans]